MARYFARALVQRLVGPLALAYTVDMLYPDLDDYILISRENA
jgi:hypothetical protein